MYERHADPIDEATALTASLTDGAVAAARRANAPETHPEFDGESCVDCGVDIPKLRLDMGKVRCVDCQTIKEHRGKLTARPNWNSGSSAWEAAAE